mmetsp:Transcript_10239/g.21340  ORF Transcript_10239/g.21340 Transcript_10239/m.21340 type:complete len:305 (+) Transcript_10239:476-1390(+)
MQRKSPRSSTQVESARISCTLCGGCISSALCLHTCCRTISTIPRAAMKRFLSSCERYAIASTSLVCVTSSSMLRWKSVRLWHTSSTVSDPTFAADPTFDSITALTLSVRTDPFGWVNRRQLFALPPAMLAFRACSKRRASASRCMQSPGQKPGSGDGGTPNTASNEGVACLMDPWKNGSSSWSPLPPPAAPLPSLGDTRGSSALLQQSSMKTSIMRSSARACLRCRWKSSSRSLSAAAFSALTCLFSFTSRSRSTRDSSFSSMRDWRVMTSASFSATRMSFWCSTSTLKAMASCSTCCWRSMPM